MINHRCYCIIILVFIALGYSATADDSKFEACAPQNCGTGPNISYPFWISNEQESYCGYPNFEISCNQSYPILALSENDFIIRDIFYSNHSFIIARAAEYENSCNPPIHNISLERTPFNRISANVNLYFRYNCSSQPMDSYIYPVNCDNFSINNSFAYFHMDESLLMNLSCESFVGVPVDITTDYPSLMGMSYSDILKMGFLLNFTANNCSDCESSGGRCGFENKEPVCYCRDGTHVQTCDDGSKKVHQSVVIGVATGLGGLILLVAAFLYFYQRRNRRKYAPTSYMTRGFSSAYSSRTDCEKDECYGIPIFDYEELREATNNFDQNKEVGDGGFGTVYKGKLRDGRVVAIKRLYENNYKRKEQFLNEVEILARLRHPNLVILYGCTSPYSQRLLLVYEFISNGTVADHLHGDRAKPGSLSWFTRLNIAIETAAALLYLHRSDVIHRDVKTYNILLDDNFLVKVADFGLSRLFPVNVTHVSTAPQGTPGYVDPEYHQCYQLTEKSDVYSFGVVLMELISSLPAVDITRHRHEINLSTMAINKIQSGALHELVDKHLGYDCNDNIQKMITAVAELAFRCLQDAKEMRPYMEEVLETLKSIQNLDKPTNKAFEMDSLPDDAVLLKSEQIHSPDSVMVKLDSTLTTPNASG